MVTPLDENKEISEAAFRMLVNHLINGGVHGVFPSGETLKASEDYRNEGFERRLDGYA